MPKDVFKFILNGMYHNAHHQTDWSKFWKVTCKAEVQQLCGLVLIDIYDANLLQKGQLQVQMFCLDMEDTLHGTPFSSWILLWVGFQNFLPTTSRSFPTVLYIRDCLSFINVMWWEFRSPKWLDGAGDLIEWREAENNKHKQSQHWW